jgi:hypothetical protein
MRNQLLAITAIVAAMSATVAVQAQSTVGTAGGAVVVDDGAGIAVDRRPAFREYIVRERVPSYTIPDRVVIGGVLPEVGVTYYDVPQSFGATPYRYTVVNGRTVLVEPRSRRIVQVNISKRAIVRLPQRQLGTRAPPGLPPPGRGSLCIVSRTRCSALAVHR